MQAVDAFRKVKASKDFSVPGWCRQTTGLPFCQANTDGDKCKGRGALLIFIYRLQCGYMLQGNQIFPCVHLNTAIEFIPFCLNYFKTKQALRSPPTLLIIYFFV